MPNSSEFSAASVAQKSEKSAQSVVKFVPGSLLLPVQ